MKNTAMAVLLAFAGIMVCQDSALGADKSPPVPKAFSSMTNADVFPGLVPAAIYVEHGGLMEYLCMGAVIAESQKSQSVILPQHVFAPASKSNGPYAVRLMRPDSMGIVGFIQSVECNDPYGADIAVGAIGTNKVLIDNIASRMPPKDDLMILIDRSPTIRGATVNKVRSLLTGKAVVIVGYGYQVRLQGGKDPMVAVNAKNPFLMVEAKAEGGPDGDIFIDDHRRIFILHAGLIEKSKTMEAGKKMFKEEFGREPTGIAALSGVIKLFSNEL